MKRDSTNNGWEKAGGEEECKLMDKLFFYEEALYNCFGNMKKTCVLKVNLVTGGITILEQDWENWEQEPVKLKSWDPYFGLDVAFQYNYAKRAMNDFMVEVMPFIQLHFRALE